MLDVNGGQIVHPVLTPMLIILLINKREREGGSNQNLILFIYG